MFLVVIVLDIKNVVNKYQDLKVYMSQQIQNTGFIPLSPVQFGHTRDCTRCQVDKNMAPAATRTVK